MVSIAEAAMEEAEDELQDALGELRIVTWTFVAEEGMCSVDLEPVEADISCVEASEDRGSTIERNVRILSSPDHEEFAVNLGSSRERIVVLAETER